MQINGQPFTDQDGLFVEQGDTLRLAVQGLAQIGDVQTAMVTIGDADPVSFVVTAIADITPDAFSFAAKEVAVKANPTPVESATITISGLNTAANISVTGGEYKIDGGSYVSTGGQISNGQQVTVRTTPGAEIGDEQTVTLTIGTVSQDFIVTTIEDLVSTMAFPPPFSFTSEGTLKARAIAKAKAGIKTVTIQVLNASDELQSQHDATLESDGSYSAEVTLTDGDNYLRAIVTDSNDVTNQGDAPETVHLVKTTNSVSGAAFGIPSSAALHEASQTLFVGNRSGAPSEVVKVDLTTGVRTQVAVAASGSWGHLRGVAVHNDDLYVTSWQTDKINKLPVSHSDKSTALTDAFLWTNSGADTSFNLTTQEISVDLDGNRLLVPTKDQKRVFAFDLTTKAVSQLTDDDMGVAPEQVVLIPAKDSRPASFVVLSNWATTAVKDLYEMPYSGGVVTQWVDGSFTQPLVAAYDSKRDQLILVDDGDLATPNTIYSISLDGNKTVAAISDAAASLASIWGEAIAVPSHSEFAYITDAGANNGLSTQGGVLAVDLQTGARVYITKE